MNDVDELLEKLKDAIDEKDDRLHDAFDAGVVILWIAREHVEAHASEELKIYFNNAVAKFMPVANEMLLVDTDDGEYILPETPPSANEQLVDVWLEERYS